MIRVLPLIAALAACAPAAEGPAPAAAPAAAPAVAGDPVAAQALLNRWVRVDDPARAITIDRGVDGFTFGTQTNGLTDSVDPMRFVSDCGARAPVAEGGGAFVVGAEACWRIVEASPAALVLVAPDGATRTYRPG